MNTSDNGVVKNTSVPLVESVSRSPLRQSQDVPAQLVRARLQISRGGSSIGRTGRSIMQLFIVTATEGSRVRG